MRKFAANEIAGRLGAVMTAGPQHGHIEGLPARRLAATVAAARLLRLDERQIATAMAIALSSAPEFPLFHARVAARHPGPGAWAIQSQAGVRRALPGRGRRRRCCAGYRRARQLGPVTSTEREHQRTRGAWWTLGHTWAILHERSASAAGGLRVCSRRCGKLPGGSSKRFPRRAGSSGRVKDVEVRTTVLSVTMEGFSRPDGAKFFA